MSFGETLKSLIPEKKYFIFVSEGRRGLETNVSPDINTLNPAHKKLLIAFLEGITEQLKK